MHTFFEQNRPHNGLTYSEYRELTIKELEETHTGGLTADEKQLYENRKINFQRSKRLFSQFQPPESLINELKKIREPQLWMVITETWCGDSSQNLPIIAKAAEINSMIDLRIIFRDENPDIMDEYLTGGKYRSIPILVSFDSDGNEIFRWGPRPATGKKIVEDLKKKGHSKEEFLHNLHLWYGKNRGKETAEELSALIRESFEYIIL